MLFDGGFESLSHHREHFDKRLREPQPPSGVFRQAQCDSLVAMFFKFWVCCFRFQVLGLWFMVYFGFFDGGVLSTNKKDVFLYF